MTYLGKTETVGMRRFQNYVQLVVDISKPVSNI